MNKSKEKKNSNIIDDKDYDHKNANKVKYSVQSTLNNIIKKEKGKVSVAKYYPGGQSPVRKGYQNILIHTKGDNLGGDLSPYVLRDENGCLIENIWQFSKVYKKVTKQRVSYSRFTPDKIIWEHPEEIHIDKVENNALEAYWNWRKKGFHNEYAVRYPNGFHGRTSCLFSLWPCDTNPYAYDRLDYIEARKKIYCGEYIRLAPKTPHFKKLKEMIESGQNIQIVEVDGPDTNLIYPPYDQISRDNPGLDINEHNIKLLVNDPKKPFGHGFVIAALLLDGADWMK